jgi:general secretion pathway protein E
MMVINNAIKKQIVKSPDAVELRSIALASGMVSLLEHGSDLVRQGITTVSEVLRTAKSSEERS